MTACTMDGNFFAASTIAHPMRCVKESFSRRALSCWLNALRTSQRNDTRISRNEVAVGIVRLASMFFSRRSAGPLRGSVEAVEAGDAASRSSVVGSVCVGAGASPFTPLSKKALHSGATEEGSRRKSS